MFKQQVLSRLENNTSQTELIQRENSFRDKMHDDYWAEKGKVDKGELPALSTEMKNMEVQESIELNFTSMEKKNQIPEDYSHFIRRNEQVLESAPETSTLYHWVHHSCSMWMPGPVVTPKTPVKMNKMDFSRFSVGCVICGKVGISAGATAKCAKADCNIYFHVECSKRANYYMEVEKKAGSSNREKVFKIYCESHRPFKIIQEINELNKKELEDITKFTRTIEKCQEIQQRHNLKPKKLISKTERNKLLRQVLQNKKQELSQLRREQRLSKKPQKEKLGKPKKWKEREKKQLFDRIKEKYMQIKKMRINTIKIDPMIAQNKKYA